MRRDSIAREASERFKRVVVALDRGCIAETEGDPCEGLLHAHHVVTQQQLRDCGLFDDLWNPSVGAVVCERHHRRHHNRTQPLRMSMLPGRCLLFAHHNDLGGYLDRYYA